MNAKFPFVNAAANRAFLEIKNIIRTTKTTFEINDPELNIALKRELELNRKTNAIDQKELLVQIAVEKYERQKMAQYIDWEYAHSQRTACLRVIVPLAATR